MTFDNKIYDSQIINGSLKKVVKGTAIVFFGTLISTFLIFLGRVLIIRYWSVDDYGVFSLCLAVLYMFSLIAGLGLRRGSIRNIAYVRGQRQYDKISDFISISLFFSTLAAVLIGLSVFFSADFIALKIFKDGSYILPLKIFSIGIPVYTLIDMFVSFFRGYDDIRPTVIFKFLLINVLFPLSIGIVVFYKLSFIYVFYGYICSIVITLLCVFSYVLKHKYFTSVKFSFKSIISPTSKGLLVFSLPLLGLAMLTNIIFWTDNFMIELFKTSVEVGYYNAANPLAQLLTFPLISLMFIYIPIITGLYSKGQHNEMNRNFVILSKWLFLTSFPIFAVLFLFPGECISYLFGVEYLPATLALRILSIGYIFNNLFGLCTHTLLAIGKTKFIMYASISAAVINIVLNTWLIPIYGINGAAFASVGAMLAINIVTAIKLYYLIHAHPVVKNLIKPVISSSVVIGLIYFVVQNYMYNIFLLFLLFLVFCIVVIGLVILSKSLDKEDLHIIQVIGDKIGFRPKRIEKLLKKFI